MIRQIILILLFFVLPLNVFGTEWVNVFNTIKRNCWDICVYEYNMNSKSIKHIDKTFTIRFIGVPDKDWKYSKTAGYIFMNKDGISEVYFKVRENNKGLIVLPELIIGHEVSHLIQLDDNAIVNPDDFNNYDLK